MGNKMVRSWRIFEDDDNEDVPCQPALCRPDPVSYSVDRMESKTGSERLYLDHWRHHQKTQQQPPAVHQGSEIRRSESQGLEGQRSEDQRFSTQRVRGQRSGLGSEGQGIKVSIRSHLDSSRVSLRYRFRLYVSLELTCKVIVQKPLQGLTVPPETHNQSTTWKGAISVSWLAQQGHTGESNWHVLNTVQTHRLAVNSSLLYNITYKIQYLSLVQPVSAQWHTWTPLSWCTCGPVWSGLWQKAALLRLTSQDQSRPPAQTGSPSYWLLRTLSPVQCV